MSFVQRELDRISEALREPSRLQISSDQYERLYAAQQALSWVLEPSGIRSPYDTILDVPGVGVAPTGVSPVSATAYVNAPAASQDYIDWQARNLAREIDNLEKRFLALRPEVP
jgi:hypothetical protein